MISEGRAFILNAPWITLFPGAALCWSAISLAFIVEGISRREGKV
jgi:ABC-type dipeptide/oligopeptide/nickel transport system permease subunit